MKRRILLLALIVFFLCFNSAFPQEKEPRQFYRNQVGIQLNPYIDKQFFDFRYMNTVSALRYGYRVTKNITTGIEITIGFPVNLAMHQSFRYINSFNYRIGIYTRYSYPAYSRFQIFAEVSPYYFHYWKGMRSSLDQTPYRNDKFGYYAAPGVSLYSKNKRISFDLYYKFSNLYFINGRKSVLSYKVNFNF